jgi:antitoxin component YwqK of YwqJK toxin-antitoxin module
MIKKTALISAALFLISQNSFSYIDKTKVLKDSREAYYIYTDEKGAKIAKERILPNGKTELILGGDINGEVRELDDKGSLIYLWHYKDNRLDGLSYKFYTSGAVCYELTYEKDVLQGPAKKYYEDGTLAEEVIYVNGKVEGIAKVYLKNGNYYEYRYKNGRLDGKTFLYDSTHRLLETLEYKNNVLDGTVSKYYLSGALKSDAKYVNGKESKGSVRVYDEKGRQIMQTQPEFAKKGAKEGSFESYDANKNFLYPSMERRKGSKILSWQGPAHNHMIKSRKMVAEFIFFVKKDRNKKLNGKQRINYRNGNIRFEGSFVNDRPHGIFKTYLPDGTLTSYDYYISGKLHGISRTYYATGLKLAEYRYWNGEINGLSKVYNKNGGVIMEANYKKNLMHGAIKVFSGIGALCFESHFLNGAPAGHLRYYFPDGQSLKYLVEFKGGRISKSVSFSDRGFEEFMADY